MTLNEVERELFEKIIYAFVKKHGEDALKDIYKMGKEISQITCGTFTHLPVKEMYYYMLFDELQKEEYVGLSLHQQALKLKTKEGISVRTVYSFFHSFYKKRLQAIRSEKRK